MKSSEIAVVKELQPSVSASCCRGDRHANNQVDIKSRVTTQYLRVLIYYRVKGRGMHRPCMYMFGYPEGRYGVIVQNPK